MADAYRIDPSSKNGSRINSVRPRSRYPRNESSN